MSDDDGKTSRQNVDILGSAKAYAEQLFRLIASAKNRIYLTALYLQDDEAGQKVLTALYQAKQNNPELDICLFVDAHRAQRGLIGQAKSLGNRQLYLEYANQYQHQVAIYGIAVKSKEWLGVLHLKGMVFDDLVLYSGASINNVYLNQGNNYRLDRYYLIESAKLADTMVDYLAQCFINSGLALDLNSSFQASSKAQKHLMRATTRQVKQVHYPQEVIPLADDMQVTALVGCGRRRNPLNNKICQLIKDSQHSIIIFTPYFNLPRAVIRPLVAALKRKVQVTLVVGDKTASDFYLKPSEPHTFIGIIPYIYEQILRRFVKRWQAYISTGQLQIKLWRDRDNSYHAKGIIVDEYYHLLTGSNLNPRAWSLDLENGLLITDPNKALMPAFEQEYQSIIQHTQPLSHYSELESLRDYPLQPRKQLRRLTLAKIDRILKRFL